MVTNDVEIAEKVRLLRNHGRTDKYEHLMAGYGYRLDALQAAILNVKLRYMDEWNDRRRANAEAYRELLTGLELTLPEELEHLKSVYHLFVICTRQRDAMLRHLKAKQIHAGIHYPIPLHMQPAFQHLGYKLGDFPHTEQATKEVLSLPLYPELSIQQIEKIAESIREF